MLAERIYKLIRSGLKTILRIFRTLPGDLRRVVSGHQGTVLDSSNLATIGWTHRTNWLNVRQRSNDTKELAMMSGDKEESEKLETKASQMIDQSEDDQTLDEAAEMLAKAERLKGPLDKSKTDKKADPKKSSD
jgi:hypothetical protein